jgi:hypothetical protein
MALKINVFGAFGTKTQSEGVMQRIHDITS